jgi:CheY-like chemotaxis protein/HPt (histidine-containing phosphotransfer) domain-containing protein
MSTPVKSSNFQTIRILVIDDSVLIQKALRSFLEELDIEVITCNNGLEGIQYAIETKPRLIFLDLLMPNLDGIKMLQVKQILPEIKNIPVVIISANTNKQNVISAIELGAVKVISKPLQKEIIIKTLKEILQNEWDSVSAISSASQYDMIEISDESKRSNNSEFKDQLVKIFLNNFTNQKKQIVEAIKAKNTKVLKTVIHDIKGAGGTVGYGPISEIATLIQDREINSEVDWFFVQVKCEQLFSEVKKIEEIAINH